MTDLWKILQADHDRLRDLLGRLTGDPGTTADTVRDRRAIARQLVDAASGHEAAEELVIWPAVRRRCPRETDRARRARRQERELLRELDELDDVSAGDEEFDAWVARIAGLARAHLSYEEDVVWPRLDDELVSADTRHLTAQWLTTRWQTARSAARVRA